mgnify:FL=1
MIRNFFNPEGFNTVLRMPTQGSGVAGAGHLNGTDDNLQPQVPNQIGAFGAPSIESMQGAGSDNILEKDLDRRLTQIRPYDSPIDTIARELGNTENCESIEVDAGSIGTIPLMDRTNFGSNAPTIDTNNKTVDLKVLNSKMWTPHCTFQAHMDVTQAGVTAAAQQGTTHRAYPIFYVYDVDYSSNTLKCLIISFGGLANNNPNAISANVDFDIQRLAVAVNEKTAMITANAILPELEGNYCQRFMITSSIGVLAEMHKKKVDYGFDAIKANDIWDYKRQIESAYTFGVKSKFADVGDRGKQIYTCSGAWEQITHDFSVMGAFAQPNSADLFVDITEEAFRETSSSQYKIMLCGKGLMSNFMKSLEFHKQMPNNTTQMIAGIEFHKIQTNHGTLLVKAHNLFIGHHNYDGLIIDPAYVTKMYFQRPTITQHDLIQAGIENSKSQTLSEVSTIIFKNPNAHMRIIGSDDYNTGRDGTSSVRGN